MTEKINIFNNFVSSLIDFFFSQFLYFYSNLFQNSLIDYLFILNYFKNQNKKLSFKKGELN